MSKLQITFRAPDTNPAPFEPVIYTCDRAVFGDEPEQTVLFGYFDGQPTARTLAFYRHYNSWHVYPTPQDMWYVPCQPPTIEVVD